MTLIIFTLWWQISLLELQRKPHSLSSTLQNWKAVTTFPFPITFHWEIFSISSMLHFIILFESCAMPCIHWGNTRGEHVERTLYLLSHTTLVPPTVAILAFCAYICLGLLSMKAEFCENDMKKSKVFKLLISCFLFSFNIWNWATLSCWNVEQNSDVGCPWKCLLS